MSLVFVEKDDLLKWQRQIKRLCLCSNKITANVVPEVQWLIIGLQLSDFNWFKVIFCTLDTLNDTCTDAQQKGIQTQTTAQIVSHKKKRLQRSSLLSAIHSQLWKKAENLHHAWNEVMQRSKRSSHIPLHNACVCSAHQHYELISILHFDTLTDCAIMFAIRE